MFDGSFILYLFIHIWCGSMTRYPTTPLAFNAHIKKHRNTVRPTGKVAQKRIRLPQHV
jgi:hypothetical protein